MSRTLYVIFMNIRWNVIISCMCMFHTVSFLFRSRMEKGMRKHYV